MPRRQPGQFANIGAFRPVDLTDGTMKGDELRSRRDPSVSELLARRVLQVAREPKPRTIPNVQLESACQLALMLDRWDRQAALPVILTGLRMGFTVALLAIIGSETIASLAGLGHRIVHLAESMEMAPMFAYIAFVVAIAAILNTAVSALEARGKRPW